MILLTGFYLDPDPARRAELVECVRRNVDNNLIEEQHVFVEDKVEPTQLRAALPPLAHPKLRLIPHGQRVTFRHLFTYANQQYDACCVIVANADIFFDVTLRRLQALDLSGKLFCLSRWDIQSDGSVRLFDHSASQDAWIFQVPIREFPCDFPMGVPGCDNRLAFEAEHSGLAVLNPCWSVRANHLHLSNKRRYTELERVAGPTRAVSAGELGAPWVLFVVTNIGHLDDIQRSVHSLVVQPRSSCVVAGNAAAETAASSSTLTHPDVSLIGLPNVHDWNYEQARNHCARGADEDVILCFIDAGVAATPGLSEHLQTCVAGDRFLTSDRDEPGRLTVLACSKAAFASVGGFDETISDPREGLADLRAALLRARNSESNLPAHFLRRPKSTFELSESLSANFSTPARNETGSQFCDHREPFAALSFRETMGYTVARLVPGVSSHNNDFRPLQAIPGPLLGRAFTQVVSCAVSSIEVELFHSGRLYILVGTDWCGYYDAVSWLSHRGNKEMLPAVTTSRGTAFEIWSLVGGAGEKFVVPTQVALVGDKLVRRGRLRV